MPNAVPPYQYPMILLAYSPAGTQAPENILFVASFCQLGWQKEATKKRFLEGFALQTSLLVVCQQNDPIRMRPRRKPHPMGASKLCPTIFGQRLECLLASSKSLRRYLAIVP